MTFAPRYIDAPMQYAKANQEKYNTFLSKILLSKEQEHKRDVYKKMDTEEKNMFDAQVDVFNQHLMREYSVYNFPA